MTKFSSAKLTGITINLKQNQIKVGASITLNDVTLEQARELEHFLGDDGGAVEISITPHQLPLKLNLLDATMDVKERKTGARKD